MRNSDQVVSELSNELAIAILLERRLREEGSKETAKVLIETLRAAGEKSPGANESADSNNWLSAA